MVLINIDGEAMTDRGTCIWGPGVRTGEDDTTETGNGCMRCKLSSQAAHHGPHTLSVSDVGDRTKITFGNSSSRCFTDRCKCGHIILYMLRQVVCLTKPNLINVTQIYVSGDRGSTVVKVLCYKSEGRWFDPSWCQWIFH